MQPRSQTKTRELGYDRGVIGKAVAVGLAALAFAPSAATITPPSRPGAWKQVGKAATSRIGVKLHLSRSVQNMKALAFVVTSRSTRRIHVQWVTYCEFMSDDDYTETHQGTLSGVKRVEKYPQVFDGATHCDITVNTTAIKGARVTAAVFSY
jgi:hypothetical protein